PAYGYCDTYFVEDYGDEDGIYARAAAEREHHRSLAKGHQRILARELSHLTAAEYQGDVFSHLLHMESLTMPDIQSIEIQTEIQWYMRPYLLDFLIEAHHAFQLLPETLHLAINLLDRYCSRRVVYKRHYQLVGCATLLIAAKYGDRKERVPLVRELRSMCCSLYEEDMFTQMEWHVLQTLDWIIGHPTTTTFLQLPKPDSELEHMASYLTELALYHKEFIPVRPSVMASSALTLAQCILGRPQPYSSDWTVGYDAQVALNLSNILNQPSQALSLKYASPQLSSVSTKVAAFLQHQAMLSAQSAQRTVRAAEAPDLHPQTPHKPGHASVPIGVLTPPITPDRDYMDQVYGYRAHAATPTPPASG
ncbi:hypothetical protein K470DRAFT_204639, partial [Piedraia hortae CBS 480.64]